MRKLIIKVFTEKEKQGGISVRVIDFGQIVKDALAYRLHRQRKLSSQRYKLLQRYQTMGLNNAEISRLFGVSKSTVHEWVKGITQLEMYSELEGPVNLQLIP